jgi:hypothetical protein
MFDKVSQAAEKLATGVSRRGFLGSVGRWAGATALGLAGVLTTAGAARADKPLRTCCFYLIPGTKFGCGSRACVKPGEPCPPGFIGCSLAGSFTVTDCTTCWGGGGGGYIGPY